MEFKSLMHVSFFTDQMDVMRDFYENKLGLKVKIVTRAGLYKGLNRGKYSEVAKLIQTELSLFILKLPLDSLLNYFQRMKDKRHMMSGTRGWGIHTLRYWLRI